LDVRALPNANHLEKITAHETMDAISRMPKTMRGKGFAWLTISHMLYCRSSAAGFQNRFNPTPFPETLYNNRSDLETGVKPL
jgi:hypothetical protein